MEEQADIEKTATERTDQKREHASHTQHAMPARGEASISAVTSHYLIGCCTTGLLRYRLSSSNRCTLTQLSFLAFLLLMMLLFSYTLKILILNVSSRVFI